MGRVDGELGVIVVRITVDPLVTEVTTGLVDGDVG